MNTTTRPTAQQIEDARALAAHFAAQAERHDRNALNAVLGVLMAVLIACLMAWAWFTWADCTASGTALCTMALTPTRPTLWQRLRRAARRYMRLWQIRWAEDDIRGLEEDLEAARRWVSAAPDVIQYRRKLLDALHVQHIAEQSEGVR